MREILFRGKREDNGDWVEGMLTIMFGQYHIINPDDENVAYPIILETVGQYTGLKDKSGNKIFEDDIVKAPFLCYGLTNDLKYLIGTIEYEKGAFSFIHNNKELGKQFLGYITNVEVIGNVFDDPEIITAQQLKGVYNFFENVL